ncbi:conserved hypothetical protein [Rippkaea orientalis PCC 8801]|uniref:Uncharacterized protein n=1 Tax=Rippkaea orientalis (strain PCC 8801 / RF-1) TaxID=41431 RepID=B7K0H7_RIPO1|nr:hypothetical protein [Rippkaea orientalis]ACK67461.1 conserved hypothetical protein [Rippkaea orientalis PCC 8801]
MSVTDERVQTLYQLAKKHPEDDTLQEAVTIIKSLRLSQGQYKQWNDKYRSNQKDLKEQIVTISQTNESLQLELAAINQEMEKLTHEKTRILAERDRIKSELRSIEREAELAAIQVQETNSLYGKFTIVWQFLQSVFFSDHPRDFGRIDNALPEFSDQPQMRTDQASIGRDLLDQ